MAATTGVLAAAVALATAELIVALATGGRSLFGAVGDGVISLTPGALVAFAIGTFGLANRLVLVLVMAAVVAGTGALIGVLSVARRWVAPAGLAAFAALGAAAGAADPLVPVAVAIAGAGAGLAAGIAALWWLLALAGREASVTDAGGDDDPASAALARARTRRAFLTAAFATAGSAAVLAGGGRLVRNRAVAEAARTTLELPPPPDPLAAPPATASFDVPGLSPLIVPNDQFYRIDTALTIPRIDPRSHTVAITGMVARPFEVAYADLLAMADTEADVTLSCVSNEVGGNLVGNARWFGVPLDRLLDRAGVQSGADQIVGRSVDGWTGGFPVEAAHDGRPALVAVGMNGEPLPPRHGFPVRLVIAGLYGYVSDTKWLSEIELTTFDAFDAYWVPRGWARFGPIKTQSRIDVPRPEAPVDAGTVAIAGVAWAGERGVDRVEVRIDDDPWQEAELADELATTSWRQWRLAWDAGPGAHVLRVRATDGEGRTQSEQRVPPRPDGAEGHHTVRVTVL